MNSEKIQEIADMYKRGMLVSVLEAYLNGEVIRVESLSELDLKIREYMAYFKRLSK